MAGLFFYSLPILAIVKLPFAFLSVILGVALAFFPLEERPLERWIFAFFRAIYSPTIYHWQKNSVTTKFFQDEPTGATAEVTPEQTAALHQYMGVDESKNPSLAKLEGAEKGFFANLAGLFSGVTAHVSNVVEQLTPVPQAAAPIAPPPPTGPREFEIPQTQAIRVVSEQKPKAVVEERSLASQVTSSQVTPLIAGNEFISTRQAQFSVDAAPPNPPISPNIAVGQVVDQERKIVDGAIIEIRDTAGRPVRALRSNKAGHFVIVTPLEVGRYEIITEKDGFEFHPVSFEANGNLIPPILVQGKKISSYDLPVSSVQQAANPI